MQREQALAKIFESFLDPFLKIDSRFPAKNFFRTRYIQLTHFRIVHRQRFVFGCRFCPGKANDLVGELADRHLTRIAEVDWLVKIAHRQFEDSID